MRGTSPAGEAPKLTFLVTVLVLMSAPSPLGRVGARVPLAGAPIAGMCESERVLRPRRTARGCAGPATEPEHTASNWNGVGSAVRSFQERQTGMHSNTSRWLAASGEELDEAVAVADHQEWLSVAWATGYEPVSIDGGRRSRRR